MPEEIAGVEAARRLREESAVGSGGGVSRANPGGGPRGFCSAWKLMDQRGIGRVGQIGRAHV